MALVDLASGKSFWRGYYYFEEGKVTECIVIDESTIEGIVNNYDVKLDLKHPRRSNCSCPHSQGHPKSVCKHMVALYFAANPEEARQLIKDIEDEEENERIELEESIRERVYGMTEMDVREELINMLIEESYKNHWW